MKLNVNWIRTPSGVLKLLTLVLNVVCISLLIYAGFIHNDNEKNITRTRCEYVTAETTAGGFLLLDLVLIVAYCIDDAYGKLRTTEILAAVAAAVMYTICGILQWRNIVVVMNSPRLEIFKEIMYFDIPGNKAYVALCFLNALVYLGYAITLYRQKKSASRGMQAANNSNQVPNQFPPNSYVLLPPTPTQFQPIPTPTTNSH